MLKSNFDPKTVLFRCSSLGYLMVEPREKIKQGELSETSKTHCIDVYVSQKYNRFTEFSAKQCDKGNDVEDDSITTVSRLTGKFFVKNTTELQNEFIRGTCDMFLGNSLINASEIRDAKSSWDAYTFFRAKHKELKKQYYWQVLGYMWLTGARKGSVDYCLNNTPYHIVEKELKYESYNHLDCNTPAWIELQIIANHVYDIQTFDEYIKIRGCYPSDENSKAVCAGFVPIPLEERHFNFEFEYNEDDVEALKKRILMARKYISTL